jgi:hypothetical protein
MEREYSEFASQNQQEENTGFLTIMNAFKCYK